MIRTVAIPSTVRIKPGALARAGIYLARDGLRQVSLMVSEGLPATIGETFRAGCDEAAVEVVQETCAVSADFDEARRLLAGLPPRCEAVVGLGGGRALDVAKYVAHLANLPYFAVPTSLSNDAFCSPQASLVLDGRRRSLHARLPRAVVVDTDVCLRAPDVLWWSGVGDLVAKITAVADWKLAFHAVGTAVDDLAALLSDATVYQFIARPARDTDGMRLLGTALMLNGIAMEISGSSRPASGSEHLISHALDRLGGRPRPHGMQVGVASYLVALLQGEGAERIDRVFQVTGFWDGAAADPFDRDEWLRAVDLAPQLKDRFYTVLSSRDCRPEVERHLRDDPRLSRCIV
ncbi:MAG: iron-containing alcohol dehydrogenase family protein [Candidatus Krumholzibacteriia bacterium]